MQVHSPDLTTVMAVQERHCQGSPGGGVAGQHAGGSFLCSRLRHASQSAAVCPPQVRARCREAGDRHLVQVVSGQEESVVQGPGLGQASCRGRDETRLQQYSVETSEDPTMTGHQWSPVDSGLTRMEEPAVGQPGSCRACWSSGLQGSSSTSLASNDLCAWSGARCTALGQQAGRSCNTDRLEAVHFKA